MNELAVVGVLYLLGALVYCAILIYAGAWALFWNRGYSAPHCLALMVATSLLWPYWALFKKVRE